MMKRIGIVLLALLGLFTFGCAPKSQYSNTAQTSHLTSLVIEQIGTTEEYMSADGDHYEFYFGEQQAYGKVNDCHVIFHCETTNVNELGIFRVSAEEDTAAVREMVQSYLDDQLANLRSFAANYSPEDMGKIDNAGIEVIGCYVVYYILDAEDEKAALDRIEAALWLDGE